MSVPLFPHLSTIRERIDSAEHVLLGLDYDGTLTPIVDDPRRAALPPETREVLGILAGRPAISVAIISGRALDDLRTCVAVENLIYSGNHGFDISGPGLRFVEATAVAEQEGLSELAQTLAVRLQSIAGVIVENKTLSISIHFRCVAAHQLQSLRRILEDTVAEGKHRLRLTQGHKVIEIRPLVDWHKGQALRWIQDQLGQREALVLYVGDDETDEDAFYTLQDAITIKVGDPSDTSANYHLESPDNVREFLCWLERVPTKTAKEATQ